ncbi:MAG: hypothetical protein HQK49_19280 [Oligoflexia bacterium]|nr:hypothetical protein [Oligoflexia bacterium]
MKNLLLIMDDDISDNVSQMVSFRDQAMVDVSPFSALIIHFIFLNKFINGGF